MKKNPKKGSVYMLVIGAVIFVSLFSLLLLKRIQSSTYQMQTSSYLTQASYFSKEALDASLSALLSEDIIGEGRTCYHFQTIDLSGGNTVSEHMDHIYDGEIRGQSDVTVSMIKEDFYDTEKDWLRIDVATSVPDDRAANPTGTIDYSSWVLVLADNPTVRNYSSSMTVSY